MHCPKCGLPINRRKMPVVCSVSQALVNLNKAVSECLWHGHPSLKVIYGHGSGGGVSRIKPQVLSATMSMGLNRPPSRPRSEMRRGKEKNVRPVLVVLWMRNRRLRAG